MTERTQIIVALAALITLIVLMLFCPNVSAQPRAIEFKLLPPGHALTLNDGIKVRYYELDEFLQLAKFDKELVKLRADIQDLGDINNMQKGEKKGLERVIKTLENDKEILRARGLRLEKKLHESEEARVEAEGGPIWPYVVAIGGAIAGIVGISVGAGLALASDCP